MLDRFGDYVADQVVTPVRETAGQALAAVLQYLSPDSVKAVFRILRQLILQDGVEKGKDTTKLWQACHGGMLGMKYLVAIRNDLLVHEPELLDGLLEVVIQGLGDFDDDVRAVSAATLIPVAKEVVELRPNSLNGLITILWDSLAALNDDLSTSTGSIMDLLAKLCGYQQVLDAMKKNAAEDPERTFAELVPRLYPFLRHTITTVRAAVLRALLTFIGIEGEGTRDWINGKVLRLVFQNLILERDETVLRLSSQAWSALVNVLAARGAGAFATELAPHIDALISLTVSPIGVPRLAIPLDPSQFIKPSGQPYGPPSNGVQVQRSSPTDGAEPPAKRRRRSDKTQKDALTTTGSHDLDGDMLRGDL
ncbi:hypothetical protein LTS18_014801, partial [Coniosporium uncinatum]